MPKSTRKLRVDEWRQGWERRRLDSCQNGERVLVPAVLSMKNIEGPLVVETCAVIHPGNVVSLAFIGHKPEICLEVLNRMTGWRPGAPFAQKKRLSPFLGPRHWGRHLLSHFVLPARYVVQTCGPMREFMRLIHMEDADWNQDALTIPTGVGAQAP